MRFPWTIEQTGPSECVVCDADGRKLFYIVGDQGDVDIEPSVLYFAEDEAESEALMEQLWTLIERAGSILDAKTPPG